MRVVCGRGRRGYTERARLHCSECNEVFSGRNDTARGGESGADRSDAVIISQVFKGNLFAEAFALREDNMLSVNVQAEEDCCIMLFDARRILTLCPSACRYHVNLIKNILSDLAQKNAVLTEKVSHISQRTTRRKLLSYLSAEARRAGSVDFTIPFDRQQLADYLSVDRSAMSAELSKLKSEGLISYHKNKFTLLE